MNDSMDEELESYAEVERRHAVDHLLDLTGHTQASRLFARLQAAVRESSLRERASEWKYDERLDDAKTLLHQLAGAFGEAELTSEKSSYVKRIWVHRPDHQVSAFGKNDPTAVNKDELLDAAAQYISKPWLHCAYMDWLFLDSLIYREFAAFKESIANGSIFGTLNLQYFLNGRDQEKPFWSEWRMQVGFLAVRYLALPLTIGFLWYDGIESNSDSEVITAFIVSTVYALYVLWRIIRWLLLRPKRRHDAQKLADAQEILQAMHRAYAQCSLPVVSTTELRRTVHLARDRGAVFDGAFYAILDRVCSQHPISLVPLSD